MRAASRGGKLKKNRMRIVVGGRVEVDWPEAQSSREEMDKTQKKPKKKTLDGSIIEN